MIINLSAKPSLISQIMAELRDKETQLDRGRFRQNLERLGELMGYEVTKRLDFETKQIETPLGKKPCQILKDALVLATILRASLPMHLGMLRCFDSAESAFISAYRVYKPDGSITAQADYLACPDLDNKVFIVIDPMLATASSMLMCLEKFMTCGSPKALHIVCAIASEAGVQAVAENYPQATIWAGDIDADLNSHGYIVPGLGDAGDLSFGLKKS